MLRERFLLVGVLFVGPLGCRSAVPVVDSNELVDFLAYADSTTCLRETLSDGTVRYRYLLGGETSLVLHLAMDVQEGTISLVRRGEVLARRRLADIQVRAACVDPVAVRLLRHNMPADDIKRILVVPASERALSSGGTHREWPAVGGGLISIGDASFGGHTGVIIVVQPDGTATVVEAKRCFDMPD